MLPLILRRPVEFLGRLGHDLVAVIVEPVDQRPDRGIFLIFHERRIVIGAQQIAALLEAGEKLAIVDVEAERPRGGVKIGAVYEEGDLLTRVEHGKISF
jgi:hypothetical protein